MEFVTCVMAVESSNFNSLKCLTFQSVCLCSATQSTPAEIVKRSRFSTTTLARSVPPPTSMSLSVFRLF